MYKILKYADIKSVVFHSKVKNKNDLFNLIKKRYYKVVVTTSILERAFLTASSLPRTSAFKTTLISF